VENEQVKITPERPNVVALKKQSKRSRIVETIAKLNSIAEPSFDLALIAQLQNLPEVDFAATTARVMTAVAAAIRNGESPEYVNCPRCHEPLAPPSVEVQISRLTDWQEQRHGLYGRWSPYELRKLAEHLQDNPGAVSIPMYPHSCYIRQPSGHTYRWDRRGMVVEP
jgi:hypothetical protein